jgi:hypothetical protein
MKKLIKLIGILFMLLIWSLWSAFDFLWYAERKRLDSWGEVCRDVRDEWENDTYFTAGCIALLLILFIACGIRIYHDLQNSPA